MTGGPAPAPRLRPSPPLPLPVLLPRTRMHEWIAAIEQAVADYQEREKAKTASQTEDDAAGRQ